MHKFMIGIVKFVIFLGRLLAVVTLVPIIIGVVLQLTTPRTLSSITRAIMSLSRLPTWGSWLILIGAATVLLVAFAPIIVRSLGKGDGEGGV